MKNIILKGALSLLCLASLTACNDQLDITPQSEVSPSSYLLTADQLASYTIKYYAQYSGYSEGDASYGGQFGTSFGTGGESPYLNDRSTDNQTTRSGNSRYESGLWTVGSTGGFWNFNNIYAINYYLNTVVPRLNAGTLQGDATLCKHYVGEGYFLRAQEYFFRLRKLGDFPIIKNTLSDDKAALIEASKRQPRNEVARFIIQDLDSAITLLSNTKVPKSRITKNVALLLKSRVALYEGTFEKYHAGTPLVPKATGWPGAEKDYLKNYEFPSGSLEGEEKYFFGQAMDAAKQVADACSLTSNTKVERTVANNVDNPYYSMFCEDSYASLDKMPEALMYRSYDQTMKVMHWFNHYLFTGFADGFTHQFEHSFLCSDGLPCYASPLYKGDDSVGATKENRDWRWKLFMKAPGDVKCTVNTTSYTYFPEAPAIYSTDVTGVNATSTGYPSGKGFSYNQNNYVSGQDISCFLIYRAAEAYLNYIEAEYELNGTLDATATSYWQALRARAGVSTDINATIAATDMSKEADYDWGAYSHGNLLTDKTLYNIRRERRCEFIGEGMRYDDLVRWRAMDQLKGFHLEGMKLFDSNKNLLYTFPSGAIKYDNADEKKNTTSSPSLSQYVRPLEIVKSNNNYYNGLYFVQAHYLNPIAINHFLITASDGQTISTSPIYQNPGWPTTAGTASTDW